MSDTVHWTVKQRVFHFTWQDRELKPEPWNWTKQVTLQSSLLRSFLNLTRTCDAAREKRYRQSRFSSYESYPSTSCQETHWNLVEHREGTRSTYQVCSLFTYIVTVDRQRVKIRFFISTRWVGLDFVSKNRLRSDLLCFGLPGYPVTAKFSDSKLDETMCHKNIVTIDKVSCDLTSCSYSLR